MNPEMIAFYCGLTALVVGLYLNISATVHLRRGGHALYEGFQIRAQIVVIWLFPFVGSLLVMYLLEERGRGANKLEHAGDSGVSDDTFSNWEGPWFRWPSTNFNRSRESSAETNHPGHVSSEMDHHAGDGGDDGH